MADEKKLTNEVTVVGILIGISQIIERGEKSTEIITARIMQPGKYPTVMDIEFMNDRIDEVLEFEDRLPEPLMVDADKWICKVYNIEDIVNLHEKVYVRIRASVNGRLWKKKDDPNAEEKVFMGLIGWSIKPEEAAVVGKSSRRSKHTKKAAGEKSSDAMPGDEMPGGDVTDPEVSSGKTRRGKGKPVPEGAQTEDDAPF